MEVGTVNVCRVPVPVSGASDMQLEVPYIIFFWYRFSAPISSACVTGISHHTFIYSFIHLSIHSSIHS